MQRCIELCPRIRAVEQMLFQTIVLCLSDSVLITHRKSGIGFPTIGYSATLITCILDWWHISMRVQHIEQALRGVYAAEPQHRAGLEIVEWRIGRLKHLIS